MDRVQGRGAGQPVRVIIVDDSTFFRYQMRARLTARGWRVVASLASGEEALSQVAGINPDLVLMDVMMPGMGGIAAVRELRKTWTGTLFMMSAHTEQGARATWQAIDAGADDFMAKPDPERSLDDMVGQLVARFHPGGPRPNAPSSPGMGSDLRARRPRALVIGASTGGPRALSRLFEMLKGPPQIPIFVVQHMPGGFTRSFADRLGALLGSPVMEAPPDGSPVGLSGAPVIVAAGGKHLRVSASRCWCEDGERRHGVIPSVDVTLSDAVGAFGSDLGVLILTGMGEDGAEGSLKAHQSGATVVVESPESALVWGMPGAAAAVGAADAVWPLEQIAEWVQGVMRHERHL